MRRNGQPTLHAAKSRARLLTDGHLAQHQLVARQRSRLVRQQEAHVAQRLAERHGVAVHALVLWCVLSVAARESAPPYAQVLVVVDEGDVRDLDQLQQHLQRRGHHAGVEQQEAQRDDHADVGQVALQVPVGHVLVEVHADGREDDDEEQLP